MKELLNKILTKGTLKAVMLFAAPIIGFTLAPDAADAIAEHVSGLIDAVMSALPTEEVPAE